MDSEAVTVECLVNGRQATDGGDDTKFLGVNFCLPDCLDERTYDDAYPVLKRPDVKKPLLASLPILGQKHL
jgi:hypothetical protein